MHSPFTRDDLAIMPLLLTEVFGPTVLIGAQRRSLLPVVGASASEIRLRASKAVLAAIEEECGDEIAAPLTFLRPVNAKRKKKGGGAGSEDPDDFVASLLWLDAPPDSEALLAEFESVLARVVHDGVVVVDCELPTKVRKRLVKLLEGSLDEFRTLPENGGTRLSGWGRRRQPGHEAAFGGHEPASLTAVVYAQGDPERVNPLIVDLLFRQNIPPALVLVLDDADPAQDESPVPADLWGMAPFAETQPALLKTEGIGRAAAYAAAMEHIDTDLVVFYEGDERLAPNQIGVLAAAMTDREDWAGAAAQILVLDSHGEALGTSVGLAHRELTGLAARLDLGDLAPSSFVVRRSMLDDYVWDSNLRRTAAKKLQVDVASSGPVGTLPLTLSVVPEGEESDPASDAEEKDWLIALDAELELGRFATGVLRGDGTERRETARMVLAGALRHAGASAQALQRLREVLEARPAALAARLDAAALELDRGDIAVAADLLDAAPAEQREGRLASSAWRLARATVRALAGDPTQALSEIESLLIDAPGMVVAHWNRLALYARQEPGDATIEAMSAFAAKALDLDQEPEGAFALTRFAGYDASPARS